MGQRSKAGDNRNRICCGPIPARARVLLILQPAGRREEPGCRVQKQSNHTSRLLSPPHLLFPQYAAGSSMGAGRSGLILPSLCLSLQTRALTAHPCLPSSWRSSFLAAPRMPVGCWLQGRGRLLPSLLSASVRQGWAALLSPAWFT